MLKEWNASQTDRQLAVRGYYLKKEGKGRGTYYRRVDSQNQEGGDQSGVN